MVGLAPAAALRHDTSDSLWIGAVIAMARSKGADLFETTSQPDMFGGPAAPVYRPNLGKVRARLQKILAEARAAQSLPWEPAQLSLYRTIFPQMADFLPEDEGAQLRFSFEEELKRFEAA